MLDAVVQPGQSGGLNIAQVTVIWFVTWFVLRAIGMWGIFTKAGRSGPLAFVPLLNIYILTKISRNPGWMVLLLLVPVLNILVNAKIMIDLAQQFSKGVGFGLGLAFLSFLFFPILGFSNAKYNQETGSSASGDLQIDGDPWR